MDMELDTIFAGEGLWARHGENKGPIQKGAFRVSQSPQHGFPRRRKLSRKRAADLQRLTPGDPDDSDPGSAGRGCESDDGVIAAGGSDGLIHGLEGLQPARVQIQKQDRQMGETISIVTPGGRMSAYRARAGKDAPAVVVAQEIFGVNQVMRETCDGLAAQGFTAICPDLFWRIEPGVDITDRTEAEWRKAFALYKAFNVDTGVEDLAATIAQARAEGAARVGVIGFCLGGLMAFLAGRRTSADAVVSYYGVGIDAYLSEATAEGAPCMLHIAEEDGFVSKDSQARIRAALTAPRYRLLTYPGRDHAFARVGGQHYHAGDAAKANAETVDFLRAGLQA